MSKPVLKTFTAGGGLIWMVEYGVIILRETRPFAGMIFLIIEMAKENGRRKQTLSKSSGTLAHAKHGLSRFCPPIRKEQAPKRAARPRNLLRFAYGTTTSPKSPVGGGWIATTDGYGTSILHQMETSNGATTTTHPRMDKVRGT